MIIADWSTTHDCLNEFPLTREYINAAAGGIPAPTLKPQFKSFEDCVCKNTISKEMLVNYFSREFYEVDYISPLYQMH